MSADSVRLPRLLYIGDVAVADTLGGESLLFRLLQFYPASKLSVVCRVRPNTPTLPGVSYCDWPQGFARLQHTRLAGEYELARAWRYYEVPSAIARVATLFKPDAILTISHVSAWLAAWQLAISRRIPHYMLAHDDFVYSNRLPSWARGWADRHFASAYRSAAGRFCISDTMAEVYRERFNVISEVIYPTHKGSPPLPCAERIPPSAGEMTFGYGGSINGPGDLEQVLAFARAATLRGHRLLAFTAQHASLSARAAAENLRIETHAPIHSDALKARFHAEVDGLLLTQSPVDADAPWVSTAFPSKWADYSTMGLPVIAMAPRWSSTARFLREHPGCGELVTSADPQLLDAVIARLQSDPNHYRQLARALAVEATHTFSPAAAWQRFESALTA